jgi:hypothetical protein
MIIPMTTARLTRLLAEENSIRSFTSKITDILSLRPTATILSSPSWPSMGHSVKGLVPNDEAFLPLTNTPPALFDSSRSYTTSPPSLSPARSWTPPVDNEAELEGLRRREEAKNDSVIVCTAPEEAMRSARVYKRISLDQVATAIMGEGRLGFEMIESEETSPGA